MSFMLDLTFRTINLILKAGLTPPSALVESIPPAFEEILVKLLAKKRDERYVDGAAAAARGARLLELAQTRL